MRVIGTDVSHWESNIDWSLAYQFLPFAYFKATDGEDFIDSQFGNNQDGAMEYGTPHAPYHWWQELQNPILQAEHFFEIIGSGYKRRVVDVEPKTYCDSNKLKQLLDKDEQLNGNKAAIYTSANYWSYLRPVPTWINQYDFLIAHYSYRLNPTLPSGLSTSRLKVWQFTDYFWFPGCNETADGNWFYGTLQECRDWFGNYHPYNEVPQPPSTGLKMKSIYNGLNVRNAPNTSGQSQGHLNAGDVIEVADIGGYSGWAKIKSGIYKGNYVAVDYLGKRYMEVVVE